jgi:hypothetical protein
MLYTVKLTVKPMQAPMMRHAIFIAVAVCCTVFSGSAQYNHLGWEYQPGDTCTIPPPNYMGEISEFEGGYYPGDTVADFTVYDFFGQEFNLYEKLQEDKPVILLSGSVTCGRFNDFFDPHITNQEFLIPRQVMMNLQDEFNWTFIYGMEAHPTDGQCPSNCAQAITVDTTVFQHPDYHYRRYALNNWLNSEEHEFPFKMYCDNPDNAIYETFFARPFGIIVLNCDGTVLYRGNWANVWLAQNGSVLNNLAQQTYEVCDPAVSPPEEEEEEEEPSPGPNAGWLLDAPDQVLEESGYDAVFTSVSNTANLPNIVVYPNPSHQHWNIKGLQAGDNIEIYSGIGNLIHSAAVYQSLTTVNIESFSPGIYYLMIRDESGNAKKRLTLVKD